MRTSLLIITVHTFHAIGYTLRLVLMALGSYHLALAAFNTLVGA